jgi:DNA-binding NarL/FixJ family response regulator
MTIRPADQWRTEARWAVLMAGVRPDEPAPWVTDVDRLLARERVVLRQAADERQALGRLAAGDIDLALLCGTPLADDGLNLLEAVRMQYCDLPCLLVTGETSPRTLRRALHLRAASVIGEPVDPPVLADAVRRVLHKQEWS